MPRKRTYGRKQRGGNAWDWIKGNNVISSGLGAGLGFLGPIAKIAGVGVGLAGRQLGFGAADRAWNFTRNNHLISGGIGGLSSALGMPGVSRASHALGGQFGFGQRGGARPRRAAGAAVVMPSGVRF